MADALTRDVLKIGSFVGFNLEGKFNQRDDDAFEFDLDYWGAECVMLIQMHKFQKLTTPTQQWLAIFGVVEPHGENVSSEDGYIPFMFRGQPNEQDVVLTGTPASGKIDFPTGITGFTAPTGDITIPEHTGKVGIYTLHTE